MNRVLCPRFHMTIELIGSRWTGAVLQLLLGGPARFAELRAAIPLISDRMLSERLDVLEEAGIVTRSVLPASPIRVEYALSPKGRELQRALEAIAAWAEKWIPLESVQSRKSAPPAGRPGLRAARAAARPARSTARRSSPS